MPVDSIKKRYVFKLISGIANGLFSAIMVAIIPKALGSIHYGYLTYLQQIFTKTFTFLDAGSSVALFTKLSRNNNRLELISFYMRYAFMLLIIMASAVNILEGLDFSKSIFNNIPFKYIQYAMVYAFLLWLSQIIIKISDAYAVTASIESIKIFHKLLSIAFLTSLALATSINLTTYYYFQLVSTILFIIASIAILSKRSVLGKNILLNKISTKIIAVEFIRFCHPLIPFTIFSVLVGVFDIWILQKKSGMTEVGFYGLAFQIATLSVIFTSAMTPVITREFGKYFEENNIDGIVSLLRKYVPILYSFSAFIGVFVFFQSSNLIALFTNEQYSLAIWAVAIMGIYPMHQTYGQISGSLFYVTDRTKMYRNIGIISMAIGFLISFVLIYILGLGAKGLAIKMVLTQAIAANIELLYNCKYLGLSLYPYIKHQIIALSFFIPFAFVFTIFANEVFVNTHLSFIIAGMLYTATTALVSYFMPSVFSMDYISVRKIVSGGSNK